MIDASQMFTLFVEASPDFFDEWMAFQAEWANESSLPYYIALSNFAHHVCVLLSDEQHETLAKVFEVVERLHNEGTDYVKEAIIVGFLEDLQNTNIHLPTTKPEQLEKYLLPETRRYWHKVVKFWSDGKIIIND